MENGVKQTGEVGEALKVPRALSAPLGRDRFSGKSSNLCPSCAPPVGSLIDKHAELKLHASSPFHSAACSSWNIAWIIEGGRGVLRSRYDRNHGPDFSSAPGENKSGIVDRIVKYCWPDTDIAAIMATIDLSTVDFFLLRGRKARGDVCFSLCFVLGDSSRLVPLSLAGNCFPWFLIWGISGGLFLSLFFTFWFCHVGVVDSSRWFDTECWEIAVSYSSSFFSFFLGTKHVGSQKVLIVWGGFHSMWRDILL